MECRRQILVSKFDPRTVRLSAGMDIRRQIVTSNVDPRTRRIKIESQYVLSIRQNIVSGSLVDY